MGGVFLSHCHEDKSLVRRVAGDLLAAGIVVWFDEAEMTIGDSLLQKIETALATVDYVAVFLSTHSVQSEWVKTEVEMAMTREIKEKRVVVLPILIEDCELPLFLKGKFIADLRDPANYDDVFYQLMVRLKAEAKSDLEGGGEIDDARSRRLVAMGKSLSLRNRIIKFIIEELSQRQDPTERYWLYISLGQIGGRKAQDALIKGLKDADEFARLGAKQAWECLQKG